MQQCLQNHNAVLVCVHCPGSCFLFFIELGDGACAGDRVAEIHRLFEAEAHAGGKPCNLASDLSDQACNQESVADPCVQIFYLCKTVILVHWIIVFGDIAEYPGVLLSKSARDGEHITLLDSFDCLFSQF